ncbi:nitrogenase-stabilizing/protective protein NifW [Gynuella sunshinyii]|nr:nitrogenase-stabilizing/protective protein NifW [Gynuella sunshinyii]
MNDLSLTEAMEELSSAEDFLSFFGIGFDQSIVHINRLHIMQRFHDYLAQVEAQLPESDEALRAVYQRLLSRAYDDFVHSDAQTEKVFKVFKQSQPGFVSVEQLLGS